MYVGAVRHVYATLHQKRTISECIGRWAWLNARSGLAAPRARQIRTTSFRWNDSPSSGERHSEHSEEKTGTSDQERSTSNVRRQDDAAAMFNALSKLSAAYFSSGANTRQNRSDVNRHQSEDPNQSRDCKRTDSKQYESNVPTSETKSKEVESENPSLNIHAHQHEHVSESGAQTPSSSLSTDLNSAHGTTPPVSQKHISTSNSTATDISKKISMEAQERAVPASRWGRAFQFTSLAAGLGMGALGELGRRTVGLSESTTGYLTEANAERLVKTLCRVRGAALKLGQMISIQDSDFLPPQLAKIFDRVRESADFMPAAQMHAQLERELGQVHRGVLHDGTAVAVKIQYPGVAESIDSDIDNLMMVLKVTGMVPPGLYVDKVLDAARRELAMECDYVREAQCGRIFSGLLHDQPRLNCPAVYDALSTARVLTTALVPGVTLEHTEDMDQQTRDTIATLIMEHTLRELFEYRLMQTDPNWGNFLYDEARGQLNLIDFGATIQYEQHFIDHYIEIIHAASTGDTDKCIRESTVLGFLTGAESNTMQRAHAQAVMALGRPFGSAGEFDFGAQDVISEVKELIPVMLKHRETAPPHESYSLHRKLSGAFLLCTRLRARVDCAAMFSRVYQGYPFPTSVPALDCRAAAP
eukprot:m.957066 g.957066  ORF g.957066 m.957066 type:complete len:643 (+) comp23876_c0_seq10:221-2149(+)